MQLLLRLHRRQKLVQEHRDHDVDQHQANDEDVGDEEEDGPRVHQPIIVHQLPPDLGGPGVACRDLKHREEGGGEG
eukprot:CAMPEP_0177702660 /NCGR_PEP_ID=MMETSP0484_2-20121128/7249_1 /TAXON_ID=354590 /ORGANISM="Rhodomonas lens, Strain RHODO" /LENGTH=75 /DNA_ID=CAMNT_0019213947 /DNA_START=767 /DNA_END=990 /DNA_ORIENTATION=-